MLNYEARFYKPIIVKGHPPICGSRACATNPKRFDLQWRCMKIVTKFSWF
jgi:hypothetical protein